MVLDYYKLQEQPFGVTPDARYLFMSRTHREALASLFYGIDAGCGFLSLIAAPGLGKTTLLFHLLHQLREKARTVFLFETIGTPMDLLRGLLIGLGVRDMEGSLVQLQLQLKEELVEQARQGKRVVVALDEAQNLDRPVLELVRMLSNFETPREKLIQIILSGQPQLADKMASPELEQLKQRISIFSYLKPLSHEDTGLYIAHRLRIAGYSFEAPLFSREALDMIAEYSNGVPRNVNNLCFNALALGCALHRNPIDHNVLGGVIDDLNFKRRRQKPVLTGQLSYKRASWKAPTVSFARGAHARFAGWMPKFALGLVTILMSAALYFAGHRQLTQKTAAVHAQSVESAPAAAPSSAADDPSAPRQTDSVKTVSVRPGQTLFEICLASFGSCDAEVLQNLRRFNPGLGNLDHIEVGQKIRIPPWEADFPNLADAHGETNTP